MTPHPALCMLTGDFLVNLLNLGEEALAQNQQERKDGLERNMKQGSAISFCCTLFQNFEWPTSLIQNLLLASWLCRYLMLASCTHASLNLELLSSMSVDSLS